MTGAEMQQRAIKLYGKSQWRSALSKALKRDRITIWRYANAAHIPKHIESSINKLIEELRA